MPRILPLLLLAACVTEETSELESHLGGGINVPVIGCPKWGCNENSPVMGPFNFHELHLGGLPNKEGISVDGFWKDGVRYTPYMAGAGAEFRASLNRTVLAGHDLEGGALRILTPEGAYKLMFVRVTPTIESSVKFWVGPHAPIETYELRYTAPSTGVVVTADPSYPVCHNPPARSDGGEGASHLWEAPLEAILYTHDRYDVATKSVDFHGASADTQSWFNIACAGSALAKLHLNRHTVAGATSGYDTTLAQAQSLLKMYVSDVCGTGHAFTDQGTPLHWQNRMEWNKLTGLEYAIEALWNDHGAMCLDVHRLGTKYADQIAALCDKPACPVIVPGAPLPRGAYLVTAVPHDPY